MFVDNCRTVELGPKRPGSHMLLFDERCLKAVNEHISPNTRFGKHDHLQAAERQVEKSSFSSKNPPQNTR